MKAEILFSDKYVYRDGAIREMIIWRLPETDKKRLHDLKYRLFYGYPDECLVRYDNERGKGDHRHYGDHEEDYRHYGDHEEDYIWVSVQKLMNDFRADIEKLRGKQHE